MASNSVIQSVLHDVTRSLRPMLAHWLNARELTLRKEEQILLYLRAVGDTEKRTRALERLAPAARALLARCCAAESPLPAGVALAQTSSAGYTVSLATLGALHQAGCAFLESAAYWPGSAAWTVEHARQELLVPEALHAADVPCERPALHLPRCHVSVPNTSDAASARVAALITECLQAVADGMIRMTQDGMLAARTQRIIDAMWARHGMPASPRAPSVLAYLRAAGIVQMESSGAVAPAAAFARERERPAPAHVAALLDYQLEHSEAMADDIEKYGFAPLYYAADTLRTVLRGLDAGEAVRLADCIELVHTRATAMTRGGGPRGWNWPRSTQPTPTRALWGSIIRHIVRALYYAYGVAVECHDKQHAPCIALTAFGKFWLGGEAAPAHHHDHQQLIVQPDFTALLTHSGPWDRTAQALRIFGAHSGDDNASVFRFSRERVQAAARHGHKVDELLELLAARATYPVPDNVRMTLRAWGTPAADAVLHCDANLLWFESRAARDAFMHSGQCAAQPLGGQFALLCVPHSTALDVMQSLAALPIDYTQPPTGGISILPDGSVTSAAPHDLRIAAVRNAIAAPAPPAAGRDEPRWLVSVRRLRACPEPALLFQQLMRLPGMPQPLAVQVQLLVEFGLVPRAPGGAYAVLNNLSPRARAQLKKHVAWRAAVLFDGTPQMAVIASSAVSALRAACAKLDVQLLNISITPPPFQLHDLP